MTWWLCRIRLFVGLMCYLGLLSSCANLDVTTGKQVVKTYVLAADFTPANGSTNRHRLLHIATPKAQAGLNTRGIAYVERDYELAYYAKSEWADLPVRMLEPLLVTAFEATGEFASVVAGAKGVSNDLRLETEITALELTLNSEPAQAKVGMRLQLIDLAERRVLWSQWLQEQEVLQEVTPYAGVVAVNVALQRLLVNAAQSVTNVLRQATVH